MARKAKATFWTQLSLRHEFVAIGCRLLNCTGSPCHLVKCDFQEDSLKLEERS